MVLIGHGVGGVHVLHVIVVQFQVGGQRQRIGRVQMLLVRLVVQLVTLLQSVNKAQSPLTCLPTFPSKFN